MGKNKLRFFNIHVKSNLHKNENEQKQTYKYSVRFINYVDLIKKCYDFT